MKVARFRVTVALAKRWILARWLLLTRTDDFVAAVASAVLSYGASSKPPYDHVFTTANYQNAARGIGLPDSDIVAEYMLRASSLVEQHGSSRCYWRVVQ